MIHVVSKVEDANCITHSGTMHADEVFSTAFLDLFLGEVFVYRTNSIESIDTSSISYIYDIGRGEFDHHQGDALKRKDGITYCSFGLLWKKLGKDFLKKYGIELVDEVWNGVDKDFVEGIDADDNGVFPKIEAIYKVKTISNIIKLFNPSYDSLEEESSQFEKACGVAKSILEEEILYINGKCYAEKQVMEYLEEMDENAKYLVLDHFLPYEDCLLAQEKANSILYVAYPSNRGGYAIKVLPKNVNDRSARVPFPEEWAGLEGEVLEEKSGISGLTFCHMGRFIVNCRDLDTVYQVFDKIC